MSRIAIISSLLFLWSILFAQSSSAAVVIEGEIVEAQVSTQLKRAGVFTQEDDRDLKCLNIELPKIKSCTAHVDSEEIVKELSFTVPGLESHKNVRRGKISFSKGEMAIYQRLERVGFFRRGKPFFGRDKIVDQAEVLLTRESTQYTFALDTAMLYLDHATIGEEYIAWTQYTCEF